MLVCQDSYEFLKTIEDYGNDIIYCDPPYALGSEVIVRKDGKVDYAKAIDFMNKWSMPDGSYWERWFIEAYRTLKHGGYLIMFGMDRQLLLFKYYAHLAGFEEQQSLYWYFISNFPKATDLSKMIDKNAGVEREVVGIKNHANKSFSDNLYAQDEANRNNEKIFGYGEELITKSSTDLAKKYDGYKYSISPLKQTNETIMVFQKPCKTGSPLHDTLAYENGDKTITVSALNIDGNRVATSDDWSRKEQYTNAHEGYQRKNVSSFTHKTEAEMHENGRYPAQTFIDSSVAERLDLQSGVSGSGVQKYSGFRNGGDSENSVGISGEKKALDDYVDIGGCSKILHKCDYTEEDYDLYFYEPKVSSSERNAGCDNFESKITAMSNQAKAELKRGNLEFDNSNLQGDFNELKVAKNNHPTLKPIALNERVLKLFKTPNPQRICYPFAGAGSEIIGGIKAGFDDWIGCEISQEYVDIANARIEYWKNTMSTQTTIFDFI